MRRSKNIRSQSDLPHAGHVAAFGAMLAALLSQKGIRHTALTRDHIIWTKEWGTLTALGWSHARPLTWPDDARQHSKEILTLLQSAGPEIAAAFRLGYIFELGPLAEWVFFDLLDNTTPPISEPTPSFLMEEWTSARIEFHLGDDSTLSEKDASRCFEQALAALQQRRLPDAKRFCLRYLLAAIASGDDKRQSAALFNLAVAFRRESRWIRAFGVGVLAGAYSLEDKAMMQQIVLPFRATMSSNLSDNDENSVFTLIPPGMQRSVQELIWQIDDLETRRRLERTASTDIN